MRVYVCECVRDSAATDRRPLASTIYYSLIGGDIHRDVKRKRPIW